MKTPKRILYIDDDRALHEIYRLLVEREGMSISIVASGEAALSALAEQGIPDVILLDYRMPGLSGEEFLAQARARFPDLATAYVLGLTGHRPTDPGLDGFRNAVSELVQKPNDLDQLGKLLQRVKAL